LRLSTQEWHQNFRFLHRLCVLQILENGKRIAVFVPADGQNDSSMRIRFLEQGYESSEMGINSGNWCYYDTPVESWLRKVTNCEYSYESEVWGRSFEGFEEVRTLLLTYDDDLAGWCLPPVAKPPTPTSATLPPLVAIPKGSKWEYASRHFSVLSVQSHDLTFCIFQDLQGGKFRQDWCSIHCSIVNTKPFELECLPCYFQAQRNLRLTEI
jgi:hypothetical protein